ncbi:MAG: hypothetical protein SNJ29_16835 [Rikenellaceae bacterium]
MNEKYHFISFTEYKAVLSKFNVAAEESKGALYGKAYSGVVYSATDNNDKKIGNPFPANAIGDFAGVKALERKYIASKETMEKGRMLSTLRGKIDNSFVSATTLNQLRQQLFDNGVGVVFRESAEGRLYGVIYIDHTTGATLNGSRLGKNYSANMVMERLRDDEMAQRYSHKPSQEQEQQHTQSQEHDQSSSFVSGGLGLFDLPSGDDADIDDIENAQMARNLKPKKKQRGRRM